MPWLEFEDPADEARYQEDFNDTIGTGSATSFMIAAIFFCLDAALFFMQEDHKILLPLDQRTQLVNSGELSMIYFTCIALAVAGFMLNSSTSGIGITGVFIPNKTILPLFSVMCSFAIWICSLMPMWTLRFAIVEQAILPRNSITIIFFILFNATTEGEIFTKS
ncbi:MAG: hypothetical protein KVP17_001534 [Porospora cf. gigantea B]|uniref:uncharacterized protein n=1 Tax=Porospora cf. gigantea B TaxID=2853592 RepID=UPI003571D844|nr:MAG: hypothetical protein KVP17_001534 [Porospora cf. gigantea B]